MPDLQLSKRLDREEGIDAKTETPGFANGKIHPNSLPALHSDEYRFQQEKYEKSVQLLKDGLSEIRGSNLCTACEDMTLSVIQSSDGYKHSESV